MWLSAVSKLIDLLTLDRARAYAVLTALLGLSVAIALRISAPERLANNVDFPAFYNAGRIIKDYSGSQLYNVELQQTLYREIAPAAAARTNLFFAYTPFFALIFVPLACLPYLPAFASWILISLALFIFGFRLVWIAAALPIKHFTNGLILATCFLPFYSWCLLIGQTSAFGFFCLALAIYLDRKRRLLACGITLALLLYKPTLLLVIIPMLAITKRWRTLAGFCIGAALLGLVSLALVGFSGIPKYLNMLAIFSQTKSSGRHLLSLDVDAFSFFSPLVGRLAWLMVLSLAALVTPFLVLVWRKDPDGSFAATITWSLVLNFYVVIYDATLIILAVVLAAGSLGPARLPRGFRWLVLAIFLLPWVGKQAAENFGIQPLTVVFIAFGTYQLWKTLRINSDGTL